MKKLIFLFILVLFLSTILYGKTVVTYPNIYGMDEGTYGYKLLNLVLSKVDEEYEIKVSDSDRMTEPRAFQELGKGTINVLDAGFSLRRSKELEPIYIPIDRGLSGWRLFVIKKKNEKEFSKIKTLNDLKTKVAGLGGGWADVKISKNSGIEVITTSEACLLFMMLDKERYDFFPLGVNEVEKLLAKFKTTLPDLVIEKSIVLKYPFARIFYVEKGNRKLKNAILEGLEKSYADGSFQKFFEENLLSTEQLNSYKLENRTVIQVPNPFLNKQFAEIDPKWWYETKK